MGKTIVCGRFEWDEEKERANIKRHKIAFEKILPMFDDPLFFERFDLKHSTLEEIRYLGMGKVNGFAIIISCYTERNGRTRIINARITSREEEKLYEQWCRQFHG